MRLECKYEVQAAHQLTAGVPMGHPCRRLHGHRYNIKVVIIGEVNPETGMILEYEEIDRRVWLALDYVDHRNLNDLDKVVLTEGSGMMGPIEKDKAAAVAGNSTVENFVVWLKAELAHHFPRINRQVGALSFLDPQVYSVSIEEDADHTVEL